ncbi:hypothetical protein Tco_0815364 [Tanacetum coccineum]
MVINSLLIAQNPSTTGHSNRDFVPLVMYDDDDRDWLLSSRMAGDRWKMTWSDVPVIPSDGRKKGCQIRLNSAPIYRFLIVYGVTNLLVYAVTLSMNITPTGSTIPRLQEVEDLQGDDLLYYDAELELMNMNLLLEMTYCTMINPFDYDEEYEQDDVHNHSEDPLASAIFCTCQTVTVKNFSTPTKIVFVAFVYIPEIKAVFKRIVTNLRLQQLLQRVNAITAGEKTLCQELSQPRFVIRSISWKQMFVGKQDEAGVILTAEQNDLSLIAESFKGWKKLKN